MFPINGSNKRTLKYEAQIFLAIVTDAVLFSFCGLTRCSVSVLIIKIIIN